MKVDYKHSAGTHTLDGPRATLPTVFAETNPKSYLDVGCGIGTWLKAASDLGVSDYYGIDGVNISRDELLIPADRFKQQNLTKSWNLGRRFDLVSCLEVAEHLDEAFAVPLVDALVNHTDCILFSAACPDQDGQHHVNCQWPTYWQKLFNERGFVCNDELRWQIWDDERIEPWYRQNIFLARRDPEKAGKEPRMKSVVHFGFQGDVMPTIQSHLRQIEEGSMPPSWYVKVVPNAFGAKLKRFWRR